MVFMSDLDHAAAADHVVGCAAHIQFTTCGFIVTQRPMTDDTVDRVVHPGVLFVVH